MRLPDRVRLVMEQLLLRRGRAAEDAEARLERAVERMDELLLDLRRSLADTLVLRRTAEASRDELIAEARATAASAAGAPDVGADVDARAERAEAELARLVRLEAALTEAETELHDQVSMIRDRMAAAKARAAGADALASLTRAARVAEVRSEAARTAVAELKARVDAAEERGGV